MKQLESILKDIPSLFESIQKEEHRAYSLKKLRNEFDIHLIDKSNSGAATIAQVLNTMYSYVRHQNESPSDFYCGISNDVVERKSQHERVDYNGEEIAFVIAVKCKNKKVAEEVESIMHNEYGFYIGKTNTKGNGAKPDSDYVYLYRIPVVRP